MIKVNFKPSNNNHVNVGYDYFVPFTIKINYQNYTPETIYTRNLDQENFVEFRFEAESKKLYEITVVGIALLDIIKCEKIESLDLSSKFYTCLIDDNKDLLFSDKTKVYSDANSIKIEWKKDIIINYYTISEQCILGSNSCGELSCLIIKDIEKEFLSSLLNDK